MLVEQRFTGWWAECDACGWTAGPCITQAEADAQADLHEQTALREEARPDDD